MKRGFNRFLSVCGGAFALLFLLGYAAAYVDPRLCWWLALPATVLPFLSLLLLPALAVALIRGARRWAAGYLTLLLLAGLRFGAPLPQTTPAGADAASLTVMTLNAPVSILDASPDRRETHQAAMSNLVRRAAPQIIGLQEVAIFDRGANRKLHFPWHIDMLPAMGYTARRTLYDGYNMKLPVFTTLPILDQRKLLLDSAGEAPGYVVRTHFRWQGREAVHYNVHLHSFERLRSQSDASGLRFARWRRLLAAYRRTYRERAREADQLQRLIATETLPVIVSGDFNSTPHHWSYRRIAQGMTDAVAASGRGWDATWPSAFPLVRIDHVLVGPAWQVASARVVPVALSDHRPLTVRLHWHE